MHDWKLHPHFTPYRAGESFITIEGALFEYDDCSPIDRHDNPYRCIYLRCHDMGEMNDPEGLHARLTALLGSTVYVGRFKWDPDENKWRWKWGDRRLYESADDHHPTMYEIIALLLRLPSGFDANDNPFLYGSYDERSD